MYKSLWSLHSSSHEVGFECHPNIIYVIRFGNFFPVMRQVLGFLRTANCKDVFWGSCHDIVWTDARNTCDNARYWHESRVLNPAGKLFAPKPKQMKPVSCKLLVNTWKLSIRRAALNFLKKHVLAYSEAGAQLISRCRFTERIGATYLRLNRHTEGCLDIHSSHIWKFFIVTKMLNFILSLMKRERVTYMNIWTLPVSPFCLKPHLRLN
jgi:hypothetical protein